MPFAGLIANGAFFHCAVFVVVFVWRFLYNVDTMCCCHRKNAGDGAQHAGEKKMNIQWGTLYLMNCIDITLLCNFKKSLSNIYVTFFLE